MAYIDIADMAQDGNLQRRVLACAVTERLADPAQWVVDHAWELAAEPGWSEAWASARTAGVESPGVDGAVISDVMILTAVQKMMGAGDE